MVRGAIVGLGNVALEGHLPGWMRRPDVAIVAATDVEPSRRTALEARAPHARWYAGADELLAREALDVVDVCTPPSTHAHVATAPPRNGVHVLCEKPLVISPDELPPLAQLADDRGLVLHTVHNWHHAPIIKRATELIVEGAIGDVRRVVWQTLRTKPAAT